MAEENAGKPDAAPEVDPVIAEMREKTARYGAGFAVASDAFKGKGVDRMVLGAKVVIAAIVLYALVSAIWASL